MPKQLSCSGTPCSDAASHSDDILANQAPTSDSDFCLNTVIHSALLYIYSFLSSMTLNPYLPLDAQLRTLAEKAWW